jgi:hypothetical protein
MGGVLVLRGHRGWRALTRRAREARHQVLRDFSRRYAWQVAGLTTDLSQRYRLTPLLGAGSAQADLAVVGEWHGVAASVASVLVQREGAYVPTPGRKRDEIVLLATLDVGHDQKQWLARRTHDRVEFQAVTDDAAGLEAEVTGLLNRQDVRPIFADGDSVAMGEVDLAAVHHWHRADDAEAIAARLDLLEELGQLTGGLPRLY